MRRSSCAIRRSGGATPSSGSAWTAAPPGYWLCAWVKLREGADASPEEIRDFCRGRIARFKVPHYVEFVDSFPMTVTGKIQKYAMQDLMIEALGLRELTTVSVP